MTSEKKMAFVCMYTSYMAILEPCTDEEVGRLVRAMLAYQLTGEEPEFTGGERYVWPYLRDRINRENETYDKRCAASRENGKKGGRPKKTAAAEVNASNEEKPKKPKKPKEIEKEKEKEKEKENEKENKKEKDNKKDINTRESKAAKPPRPRFIKPKLEDIQAYCCEKGYGIDAEAFWDYYEANGWQVGRSPMKDWKAAVRNWMRKEKEHGRNQKPAQEIVFKNGHSL